MSSSHQKGTLEVICGSMFSGKSEELIRRLHRSEIAQRNVLAFKHSLDDRMLIEYIVSHNGKKLKAFATEHPSTILELTGPQVDVVGIDEVQFFDTSIIQTIIQLITMGKHVIVAGLDLDFRGIPFGAIPTLMAIANTVTKLTAICVQCGADAHFTQRLVNGKPAKYADPVILVGAQEAYQARCRNCHSIDQTEYDFNENKKLIQLQ